MKSESPVARELKTPPTVKAQMVALSRLDREIARIVDHLRSDPRHSRNFRVREALHTKIKQRLALENAMKKEMSE